MALCAAVCSALAPSYAQAGIPVPEYSSRPGAAYTMYLNFGGFSFNGDWGSAGNGTPGVTPAYTVDADASTFNATELANIQNTWSRVAEKYAAFDINVTTKDPAATGLTDTQRQTYYDSQARLMQTVIGGSGGWSGGGGVSYVGTTKYTYGGSGYHTNWVFSAQSSSNLQFIAEATAHEQGHGMVLDHQSDYSAGVYVREYSSGTPGTGSGTFAPIMGNSYSDQRGLWSVGTGSNGAIQDDVDLLLSYNTGLSIVNTGVGKTLGTATRVPVTSTTVDFTLAKGIITPNPSVSDHDPTNLAHYTSDYWFFNTSGGTVNLTAKSGRSTITAGSADPGMTLDATLKILDSNGNVLYSSSYVAGQFDATLNVTLPSGKYYALVTSTNGSGGTGLIDTSYTARSFYDIGSYFLTGTIAGANNGFLYWDNNGSGAGFGSASGTWASPTTGSASQGWSTSDTGALLPVNYTTTVDEGVAFGTDTVGLGAGTVTVSGSVATGSISFGSLSGAITLSGGIITLGGTSPTITVSNTTDTIGSVLAGTAGMTKAGTGNLVLTGVNTYTGATNISAGTLSLSGSGALSSSTAINTSASGATFNISGITAGSTTVGSIAGVSGSSIVLGSKNLNTGSDNTSTSYAGVISGSGGSLTKSGNGTLVLTGTNTYTGGTTLAGGNLTISSDANLGGASGGITFANSSTLQINSAIASSNRQITLGGGTATILLGGGANYSNSGKITGSGNLVFNQTGTGARTVTLGNTGNDFTGSLAVDLTGSSQLIDVNIASLVDGVGYGNLRFGTGSVTPTFKWTGAAPLSLSGRVIELYDIGTGGVILSSTTAPININTNLAVSGTGTKTLTLDAPVSVNSTFGGVIANGNGTVVVSKTGAGTWTLTSPNSYTGGTTISAGTLALSGSGALSASNVVNTSVSGAKFDISNISAGSTTVGSIVGVTGSEIALGGKNLSAGGDNTSTTYAGVISGTNGTLTKTGTGSLTLNGANTLTGGINLNSGTLILGNDAALGGAGSVLTIAGGTTVNVTAARTTPNNNAQVWNGNWTFTGSNTWNTGTGAVTLGAAAVQLTNSGANALTVGGAVGGTSNLTLDADGAGGITLASVNNVGTITNAGSGAGTTTLTAVGGNVTALTQSSITSALTVTTLNVNSGGTTLTNTLGSRALTVTNQVTGTGNLVLNNNSAMLVGITLSAGASNVGTITNSGTNATGTTTIAGVIDTNVTGVTQNGAGTLILSGASTYTGPTNVNAGTLRAGASNTVFGSATGAGVTLANVAGATLDLNNFSVSIGSLSGGGATGGNVTLGSGTLTAGGNNTSTTFSGVASGTGGLTKAGSGTLTMTNANTYSGATTINGGSLLLTGSGDLSSSTAVNTAASGTVFDFSGISATGETVGSIAGAAGSSIVMGTKNLTAGGNNTSTAFAGVIGGSGSLTKTGSGTLTLSATNTYSGGTILNAGTVIVTSDSNLGTGGGITATGTATLNLNTTTNNTYARDVTINPGAVLTVTSLNAGKTISGVLSGSGQIINSSTTGFIFSNTGNTFTGTVNNGYQMVFASLGDSTNSINLIGSNSEFQWSGSAKTFALRPFTLQATGTGNVNNNGTGSLIIQQNLAITGTAGARTLALGGTYSAGATAANRFAGNIADGVGSTVGLTILGTSNFWALSGNNTYSGTTTVGAGGGNGPTLIIQGSQALSPNTTVKLVSNSTPSGSIRLLDDTVGTINLPNTISQDSANGTINFQIFVGNNNTANGGTGSGTTTGSTISINKLSADIATMNNTKTIYGIKAEGANSYTLGINNVEIPAFLSATYSSATSWKWQLAANTAPISITGTVQQLAGSTSTTLLTQTLELIGTNTGSIISGSIKDSLDGTPRPLAVVKASSSGAWTLSGSNTFSGGVTLNGATVGSQLNINSSTALGTGSFTINGGNNAKFDNTSGGEITLSTNNAQTWNNDFTFIGTNNLNMGTGAVTLGGNRSITNGGTLTVGGVISGAANIGIIKGGGGTLVLTGASTFTGTTTLNQGVLSFNTIADVNGGNSALGAPTTTGNGTIALGNTTLAATLRYTGTGSTTNRVINLLSTTGPVAIDQSGTGLLKFTSAFTATGAGIKTLTLTGSTAGAGEIAGAIIDNSGTNKTSLAKTGTGAWTLSAVNTFTGSTTVSGGKLTIASTGTINTTSGVTISGGEFNYNSSTALSKAITFSGTGGRLSGTGTITPSVSVTSGNTLSPGNSIGTLTLSGGLILTGSYSVETAFTSATTATADKTVVVGAVNVTGSSLNVTELGSYFGLTSAAPIVIIQNDGVDSVTGNFTSFVGNPPIQFTVLYNYNGDGGTVGNDVALSFTAVPEPTGVALFGLGSLGFLSRRRRVRAKAGN